MLPITTHVLDTSLGRPAAGLIVRLDLLNNGQTRHLSERPTDDDGRVNNFLPSDGETGALPGTYRLRFETQDYFQSTGRESFYPAVMIEFTVTEPAQHYHVPLLISPFGYSTYRGS